MSTKTVKIKVSTEYLVEVPIGWNPENIIFQWGCSNAIKIIQEEDQRVELLAPDKIRYFKEVTQALDTVLELAQDNALDEGTCDFELMAQASEHSKALDLVRRLVAELENDEEVYYSEDGSVRYGLKHVFEDAKKFIEKE